MPPSGESKDNIFSRIDAACRFLILRMCLWTQHDNSVAIKIRGYSATVLSVFFYGYEYWVLRSENERRFDVFNHRCLGTIHGVKYPALAATMSREYLRPSRKTTEVVWARPPSPASRAEFYCYQSGVEVEFNHKPGSIQFGKTWGGDLTFSIRRPSLEKRMS
ncbi:unnamed protein product [Schistocephalus solidus]|uniref:Uncharacterized protein n=1 Tax=Schistocephalus solidus TaxID=70667 RepID=A0A183TJ39_SCHSO|nr:unnamed protein product [Schistocephalus solidus]